MTSLVSQHKRTIEHLEEVAAIDGSVDNGEGPQGAR